MKYKYMTSVCIISIILFGSVMSIITPDYEKSEIEGRDLQVLPLPENLIGETFTKKAYLYELLTGDMFKKWDSYTSDHIYKRDSIVNSFAVMQDVLDKKYVNGAFLGNDNYIFSIDEVSAISDDSLKYSAEHFNKISNKFKDSKTYIVNLPNKDMVYEEKMPIKGYSSIYHDYIDKFIDNIDKEKIEIIDFRESIDDSKELYFKTDHHWNMEGAYDAYKHIIGEMNNKFPMIGDPKSKSEFDIEVYEDYFVGTDGRKIGQLVDFSEDIEVYNSKDYENYEINNKNGKIDMFNRKHIDKDKFNNDYRVYLGGDNSELFIKNNNANNDLSIVMIGDSMDNPLIPLMSQHFKEIYSYDQRSYTGFDGDIDAIVENINPDIIMFVGLSTNFVQGPSGEIFKWNIK